MSGSLEFDVPCCYSTRECNARKLVIIGFRGKPRILRIIHATRCARGITKKIKVSPGDIILVRYYVSNRGVHYITVLWKPQNITDEQAIRIARKALGLETEEKITITTDVLQ